MPTDVIMPQMGESIFEGTITKWLKTIGDAVEKDEPLLEISTDKVDAELPSPAAGVLTEIRFPEGATVEVNTVVAVISEAGCAGNRRASGPRSFGGDGPPRPFLAARPPHRQRARPRPQPSRRHRLGRPHHERRRAPRREFAGWQTIASPKGCRNAVATTGGADARAGPLNSAR